MAMLVTAVALGFGAYFAAQGGLAGPHRPTHRPCWQDHAGATAAAAGAALPDSKGGHSFAGLAGDCQGAQECVLVLLLSCCG